MESVNIINDNNYIDKLSNISDALVFFTERTKFNRYDQPIFELSKISPRKNKYFIAYMDESQRLFAAYGVRNISSYYIISNGSLIDSIAPPIFSFGVYELAKWYNDVIDNMPRMYRYTNHITARNAGSMISYLEGIEKEQRQHSYRIQSVLIGLESVLNETEENIHQYIWNHVFLLDHFYDGAFIINKMPLGNDYVTDFVILGYRNWTNNIGIHATLIEIERGNERLFTRAGDPASFITHALRQVHDWKSWLTKSKNSDFFEKELKKIINNSDSCKIRSSRSISELYRDVINNAMNYYTSYSFMVIAGRRNGMDIGQRIRLDEMNHNMNEIEIITYDAVIEGWMRRIGSII